MGSYIGNSPGLAIKQKFLFVATEEQTIFSGLDSNSMTLNYVPGQIDVFISGRHIPDSDYVGTNGSTITFNLGLTAGDEVLVNAYGAFSPSDTLAKSQNGADILDKPTFLTNTNAVYLYRPKNRIINGAMQISQQNGTNAGTTSGYYPVDQWYLSYTAATAAVSVSQVASVTPKGSSHRIRLSVTTAKTSLASGDFLSLTQPIEGNYIKDSLFGTSSAKKILVEFGLKAPIGTYAIRIGNSANNRSYIATIDVTNTNDNYYSFVIPGDTSGIWASNQNIGFYLSVTFASGTTYQGTTGWQNGNIVATAATTNGLASTSNIFELFDVGLYIDSYNLGLVPPWELPQYDEEILRCKRYFRYVPVNLRGYSPGSGYYISSNIQFDVPMRTTPTAGSFNTDPETTQNLNAMGGHLIESLSSIGISVTGQATGAGDVYTLGYRWSIFSRM